MNTTEDLLRDVLTKLSHIGKYQLVKLKSFCGNIKL